jgi:hypothetical protein
MRVMLLTAMSMVACGGSTTAPTDELLCKKMSTLCAEAGKIPCFTAEDWAEMQSDVGKDTTTKFRKCVAKATDCGALTGCMVEVGLAIHRDFGSGKARDTHEEAPDTDDDPHAGHDHAAHGGARHAVHYDKVTVRPGEDAFGHHISVSIELTVESDMPHVGGHTAVEAACENETDEEDAFFMKMSDARKGDKRSDTIKMFDKPGLKVPPAKCQLILGLDGGATPPTKFCYAAGATVPGECK